MSNFINKQKLLKQPHYGNQQHFKVIDSKTKFFEI